MRRFFEALALPRIAEINVITTGLMVLAGPDSLVLPGLWVLTTTAQLVLVRDREEAQA